MNALECVSQGEQAYQQIINQKLMGLHLPVSQTVGTILTNLIHELCTIEYELQVISKERIFNYFPKSNLSFFLLILFSLLLIQQLKNKYYIF